MADDNLSDPAAEQTGEAPDAAAVATTIPSMESVEPHQDDQAQSLWYRIHPLGCVAGGLLVASVIATAVGTDYLIGRLAWWHWLGLLALFGTLYATTGSARISCAT